MIFYKIRHKSTGLFFKPSIWPSNTNLSKTGKVYTKLPSLANYLGFSPYREKEKILQLAGFANANFELIQKYDISDKALLEMVEQIEL